MQHKNITSEGVKTSKTPQSTNSKRPVKKLTDEEFEQILTSRSSINRMGWATFGRNDRVRKKLILKSNGPI